MPQYSLRDKLRNHAGTLGFQLTVPRPPIEACDLILHTECYEALFKIINRNERLDAHWQEWQALTAEYKRRYPDLPRDIYLTFLVARGNSSASPDLVQKISNDSLVCRKIVRFLDNGDFASALGDLPFAVYDESQESTQINRSSLVDAFSSYNYPTTLVEAFTQRKLAQRIVQELLEDVPPSTVPRLKIADFTQIPAQLPEGQEGVGCSLGELHIRDFRGLRKLDLDLSSKLVVIYGRNGTGKTSVVDAIEFALLGEVERLSKDCPDDVSGRSPLVNLFSDTDMATVRLSVSTDSAELSINRSVDLDGTIKSIVDDKEISDDHLFLDPIIGAYGPSIDLRLLRQLVRTTTFLTQHTITRFLSDAPGERYWSVSHMLGTHDLGRYVDKLASVREQFTFSVRGIEGKRAELAAEKEALSQQVKDRRRLIRELPTGRSIVRQLQELLSSVRDKLFTLESGLIQAIPSRVENYDDVLAFINVLQEFAQATKQQLMDRLERLREAVGALERLRTLDKHLSEVTAAQNTLLEQRALARREFDGLLRSKSSITSRIAQLESEISSHSRTIRTIEKAKQLITAIAKTQELLEHQQKQLKVLHTRLSREKERGDKERKRVDILEQELQEIRAKAGTAGERVRALDQLSLLLGDFQRLAPTEQVLRASLQELSELIQEQTRKRNEAREARETIEGEVKVLHARMVREADSLSRLRQLLLEIQEHAAGSQCPLCGYQWEEKDILRKQIASRNRWVPASLQDVRSKHELRQASLDLLSQTVQSLDTELEKAHSQFHRLRGDIAKFQTCSSEIRQLCDRLGIEMKQVATPSGFQELEREIREHANIIRNKEHELTRNLSEASQGLEMARTRQERINRELEVEQETLTKRESELNEYEKQLQGQIPLTAVQDPLRLDQQLTASKGSLDNALARKKQVDSQLAQAELSMAQVRSRLASIEERLAPREDDLEIIGKQISECRAVLGAVDAPPNATIETVEGLTGRAKEKLANIRELEKQTELAHKLGSWLATEDEIKRLEGNLSSVDETIHGMGADLERHNKWLAHLAELQETVTRVRGELENQQLSSYEPGINRFYRRLYTHPYFRGVNITVDPDKESLTVNVRVEQQSQEQSAVGMPPTRYLSEAQLNVLAVSIFLANAFQQRWSRLLPILLDDPVQNMDDFNANAFIDTLRSFAYRKRQFILTTCDLDFYKLLLVKLRCLNSGTGKRFTAYRLSGISSQGPELEVDAR